MKALRYSDSDRRRWDAFVSTAKNAHFMFQRNYMEYHRDRFEDHSLLVRDDAGRLTALFPANADGAVVHSHAGLSFGGLLLDRTATIANAEAALDAVITLLRDDGFARLTYKTIPTIYHQIPAEEDRYLLFRRGALLTRRDVLSVIDTVAPGPLQERRRRGRRKALDGGLSVRQANDYGPFWRVLADNLAERYGIEPVHSLAEIHLLSERFPDDIKLFECHKSDQVVGGVVIYETPTVVHAQYTANNEAGRMSGSLDLLFEFLFDHVATERRRFFDFGVSTERDGTLNLGLVAFKESFGARTVTHDHYELELHPGDA